MNRRYDIDWVRVIAIGLLLLYHVAIGFQPWGIMIGFITTEKPWMSLWTPMSMLNVWRIPLLFFVSGMGLHFAMQQRNWKDLMSERASRIFVPFVFGTFVVVPIHLWMWKTYNKMDAGYEWSPGHLWFLGNIFVYVLTLSYALFYLKKNEKAVNLIRKIFSTPLGLVLVTVALVAEVLILRPVPYEMYAMTWHGFFLGMIAFLSGFCFVLAGQSFWEMLVKGRWVFLFAGVVLFAVRLNLQMKTPTFLIPVESVSWIFTVMAFAYKYLNRPSNMLSYLSQAAYPIYILHMVFLYLGSMLIFPLAINVQLQFVLVLLFTFFGCFTFYELIVRRVKFVRPLFGLKMK